MRENGIVVSYPDKIKFFKTIDVVVKTGEGEEDFIVQPKVILTDECDLQEYVNSFADDIGILNTLEKIKITGDTSLLRKKGIYADVSAYDGSIESVKAVSDGIAQSLVASDPALAGLSIEELAKQIGDYLKSQAAEEVKEEVKDGE